MDTGDKATGDVGRGRGGLDVFTAVIDKGELELARSVESFTLDGDLPLVMNGFGNFRNYG